MEKIIPVIIIIAAIGLLVIGGTPLYQETSKPELAQLSLNLDFPETIMVFSSIETNVIIQNEGGDAEKVEIIFLSDSIVASQVQPFNILGGDKANIKLEITGKDVQYGQKTAIIGLQYSDVDGEHETSSIQVSFYLLPAVEFFDVGWKSEIFHPFGKSKIEKTDNTELFFKVHSKSQASRIESVIYADLWVRVQSANKVPGLSITPNSINIESIGPDGRTGKYMVEISSNNSPTGRYMIEITLFTIDDKFITEQIVELEIVG